MDRIPRIALCCITVAISIAGGNTLADQPRREELRHGAERHMVYDGRHGHSHYYPRAGYTVSALPTGNMRIEFGRDRFYFHGGVWYRPGRSGYVVVPAPIGIGMPMLPVGYTTVWAGGVAYYYANDVYYSGNPGNYVVVAPPTNVVDQPPPAPSAPQPPPAPATTGSSEPTAAPGIWYYCESAKSYYPYVTECKTGWSVVPAIPPK